jgi:hypothetical protein
MRETAAPPIPAGRSADRRRTLRRGGTLTVATGTLVALASGAILLALTTPAAAAGAAPDLATGVAFLVAPANLINGDYYEAFPGYADFGLTIDGAFALAATGTDNAALFKIVNFYNDLGTDASGLNVDSWTGAGTGYVSGGAIGKEALLAEVVGDNPRKFGGEDLIADLDASVCAAASTGTDTSCVAAGNYTYSTSTFDQALGIIAQLRAGDDANAAAPIAYLLSQQEPGGAWPSLIPSTGDSDVDSTAMAVMALQLAPGATAATAVQNGITWIASRQAADGGFPGLSGDSINSAALAIQALTLEKSTYSGQIAKALAFLAAEQNSDGGFNADAGGQQGSDIRASTQAVGGAVGTSFGVLEDNLSGFSAPTQTPTPTPTPTASASRTRAKPTPTPTHSTASPVRTTPAAAPVASAAPVVVAAAAPSSFPIVTSTPAKTVTPEASVTAPTAPPVSTSPPLAAATAPTPTGKIRSAVSTSSNLPLVLGLGGGVLVVAAAAALSILARRRRRTSRAGD